MGFYDGRIRSQSIRLGFTLMELVVVMSLVGIIAGGLGIMGVKMIHFQEFEYARGTIRSELMSAQADTRAGTHDSSWGVAFTANSIIRFKGANFANRDPAFDRVSTLVSQLIISGPPEIVFLRPSGRPQSGAVITLTFEGRMSTIVVNTAGSIDVE